MASQPQSQSQFSLVQYTAVRKVLKSDTMFRTLGVTRQASTNTIKRQYKKLSLLVHPDKNSAPGAEEAFKSKLDPRWQSNHRNNFKFRFIILLPYIHERATCVH